MAGLGRRTHYRKHLTDSVLHDFPEPDPPHSLLAKIYATRGSNQFDVKLAGIDGTQLAILPTKFRKLVWLKRNDYVIVETVPEDTVTDDTVPEDETDPEISRSAAEAAPAISLSSTSHQGGIRCMITHILYQDQIKHLMGKDMWPDHDPEFVVEDRKAHDAAASRQANADGIVYDDYYLGPGDDNDDHDHHNDDDDAGDDDDQDDHDNDTAPDDDPLMFVNTNRLARLAVQDSSSSSSDDDDYDDD